MVEKKTVGQIVDEWLDGKEYFLVAVSYTHLLISDFLIKLMRLPLHFFDTKLLGDIMQRIRDHGRIRAFLMGSSISVSYTHLRDS